MSKPEDIPQGVWDAVEAMDLNIAVAFATSTAPRAEQMRKSIVARAILAAKAEEREACAAVADRQEAVISNTAATQACCRNIARAIRKRGEG